MISTTGGRLMGDGPAAATSRRPAADLLERGASVAPWPKKLSAITLFTEDLAATKQFYAEVFGVPQIFEDDNSAVFDFGSTVVNLLRQTAVPELIEPLRSGEPDAGPRSQLTVDVDDVDAVCAELQRRGVQLVNGPLDRPWGIRTASFRDPTGQLWEIAK
jgi:catechol 2,3-dioxygenase-like lactoylglutathione lyase family enzyme